jgi:hypothetical protein
MSMYFGYIHGDGTKLEVKKYNDQIQLNKYIADPFILKVFGPFRALDRERALERLKKLIDKDSGLKGIMNEPKN